MAGKNAVITLRTRPAVKLAAVAGALATRRTLTNYIEMLITRDAAIRKRRQDNAHSTKKP